MVRGRAMSWELGLLATVAGTGIAIAAKMRKRAREEREDRQRAWEAKQTTEVVFLRYIAENTAATARAVRQLVGLAWLAVGSRLCCSCSKIRRAPKQIGRTLCRPFKFAAHARGMSGSAAILTRV